MTETGRTVPPSAAAALHSRVTGFSADRALQIAVLCYQLLGAGILVASVFLAITWIRQPFLGALFDRSYVVTRAAPTGDSAAWDLFRQDVQAGDQLLSANSGSLRTIGDLRRLTDGFLPGDKISIGLRRTGGQGRTFQATLTAFPTLDTISYIVLPLIASLLCLAMSLSVSGLRAHQAAGRAFSLFSGSLSISYSTFFNSLSTHTLTYAWIVGAGIGAAALVDLAVSFPGGSPSALPRRYARGAAYLVALGLVVWAGAAGPIAQQLPALQWMYAYVGLTIIAYAVIGLYRAVWARSPIVKAQGRTSLAATLLSAGPLAGWFALAPPHALTFTPLWLVPSLILPLALWYALARGRFMIPLGWRRQSMTYLPLSVMVVGAYGLVVTGIGLLFRAAMPATSPLWIGGVIFVLAVLLEPMRRRLQDRIDHTFFLGTRASTVSENLGKQLADAPDLATMSSVLRQTIRAALAANPIHIFVYDAFSEQFTALPDEGNRRSSDVRFAAKGALAKYLDGEPLPLVVDDAGLPPALQTDHARITLLGTRLIVRLGGRQKLAGWLAVGPRLSGEPYTPRDLGLLQSIADRASSVIRRVQDRADLERRLQETGALTRLAQAVNITLEYDDVLELIYAQTSRIIPLADLHLTLFDPNRGSFQLAFAVEDNKRLPASENPALPADLGLAPAVIRDGHSILASDYVTECRSRGVPPTSDRIFSWMGTPLKAGAESIGALSVGSRDPAITYTAAHLGLLQAIADQAAGAIVKARLLRESQESAGQLGKLNDIARQLASTLELESLLHNIVEGSASVLDCEACILYLVDDPPSSLTVRASAGEIPPGVVGQRHPLGTGIAGRAATTGKAVIDNHVRQDGADALVASGIGFTAQTILAAALQVQDRNIGVLEVINRRDGLPFIEQDQALLTALAGQAAVAVENVRLYTLTDRELAARVEELSIMQRIDRELNASLDSERAMRTTLEWALRQTDAEAGLIGMLDDSGLRVVAQAGYGQALDGATPLSVAQRLPGFQSAVESGAPQQVDLGAASGGGLLPGSGYQTLIPVRREASVIGLLVLEGTGSPREDLSFLSRLSDHAAIAISNAQLYDELRRANTAKSEFVSLVAHELKNPMTSIKGYAELLAAGTTGPITEIQSSFLETIRTNIERMSTLVSDLNDNSKIEAGQLRLDFKAVDLAGLIDESLRSSRRQFEEKAQTIQLALPNTLPGVWADQTRLGQVLTNLISNANKYTPEGGLLFIGAEAAPNQWDPDGARQVVHVWLKDNGIGISREDESRVFQKFFRSEDPQARAAPGAGLGLNITRSLVEMQGGRIWFESQHREGTTFHFTVPVAEA